MTIQGAMNELVSLLKADDIPIYYKGGVKKVIETIDDYINGKDDYVKRKLEEVEPTWEQVKEYCNKRCLDIVDSGLRKMWYKDEPQTDTEIAKANVHKMIDDAVIAEDAYPDLRQKMHDAVDAYEPQTERSE